MADKKISELTNITGANLADTDEFVVVDTSASETKAITYGELKKFTGTVTADGLTVDGDTTNLSYSKTYFTNGVGTNKWHIWNENVSGADKFQLVDGAGQLVFQAEQTGDISFYEDTGTTPKFFWDASAETLGIGTTTPDATTSIEIAGGLGSLRLKDSGAEIHFTRNSNNDILANGGTSSSLSVGGQSYLRFLTGSTLTERMRIDASGNVGIGTSSPRSGVDIANRGIVGVSNISGHANTGAYTISGGLDLGNGGYIQLWGGSSANPNIIVFGGSSTERMRIDGSGNVGIGTSSPSEKLHVDGVVKAANGLLPGIYGSYLYEGASNAFNIRVGTSGPYTEFVDAGSGVLEIGNAGGVLALTSSGTERMRIDTSGNVGIGTSSPSQKLDVRGNASIGPTNTTDPFQGVSFVNGRDSSASNTTSYIDFKNNLYTPDAHIFADHLTNGGSALTFGTTSAGDRSTDRRQERMRIDGYGNVGIGTALPSATLHVVGGAKVGTQSGAGLYFQQNENGGEIDILDASGNVKGLIDFIDGNNDGSGSLRILNFSTINGDVEIGIPVSNPAGSIVFSTNAAERLRIDASGRVGVGTTAPNGRVTVDAIFGINPNFSLNNFAITTFGGYGGGIAMLDSVNPNSGTGYGIWVDDGANDFNIAQGTTSSGVTGGVYINNNAGSWSSRSDERDKTNLVPITDAAAKVQNLRAVIGEYIWAEGVKHPFLIAQDVQAVLPEAVSIANKSASLEDQRLGVSYTDVIPLLTAALQEALKRIEALEAQINP